jgi:hypothetical protein
MRSVAHCSTRKLKSGHIVGDTQGFKISNAVCLVQAQVLLHSFAPGAIHS